MAAMCPENLTVYRLWASPAQDRLTNQRCGSWPCAAVPGVLRYAQPPSLPQLWAWTFFIWDPVPYLCPVLCQVSACSPVGVIHHLIFPVFSPWEIWFYILDCSWSFCFQFKALSGSTVMWAVPGEPRLHHCMNQFVVTLKCQRGRTWEGKFVSAYNSEVHSDRSGAPKSSAWWRLALAEHVWRETWWARKHSWFMQPKLFCGKKWIWINF